MFYKKGIPNIVLPEIKKESFAVRKAKEIADGVIDRFQAGMPPKKNMGVMTRQLQAIARTNKKVIVDEIKDRIIELLKAATPDYKKGGQNASCE